MSDLAAYYRRQFRWREWPVALATLPPLGGQTVLDLGCGVGDLAAELSAAGARVIGIDANEELIAWARTREIPNAEFRVGDLREDLDVEADGIWCSFTAAYFVDLGGALARWTRGLRPGGWIAVTEIDDLFGHGPLQAGNDARLQGYCDEGFAAGRYDFRAGRKLPGCLEGAGLRVVHSMTLADGEFAFAGAAEPEVLEAWRARLGSMKLLEAYLGAEYASVRDDFLGCLARDDHRSRARVCFCLAVKGGISGVTGPG